MLSVLLAAALANHPAPAIAPSTLSARISDPAVIRAAVKEVVAASAPGAVSGTVLRGDASTGFARAVDEARKPDCLHPDAMKHQPPKIGPIGIGGIYALPFWISAVVRGKCN